MSWAGSFPSKRLGAGLAAAILLAALCGLAAVSPAAPSRATATRPNIVVIMSDDQTDRELKTMPHVLDEIGARGATFDNSFVNFSLCCPSRSTFLTGLYAHNHGVLDNVGPDGGYARFESLDGHNDLPLWLHAAGYFTGQVGKYLNGYGAGNPATFVPPGWDSFNAISGAISYYDYKLNSNGALTSYGEAPGDYVDDVITGKALDFIGDRAPSRSPFFLYVAYKAPHEGGPHPTGPRCDVGPEPAPRHFGQFAGTPLPRSPSFNEADVSDKPHQIRNLPPLSDEVIARITTRYQCELEALQSVDDGVHRIIAALRSAGELNDTLVIFTSDNGYFHGEHRVPIGKVRLYEPSIRVPLLMRGPGIAAGEHVEDLAINADLAPTIVAVARATAHRVMDGESLLPALADPGALGGRRLLIDAKSYAAVRTQRYIYARHDSGELELYDLLRDPDELQNVADTPGYADAQAALRRDLRELRGCGGLSCRTHPALNLRLRYARDRVRPGDPASPRCAVKPVAARIGGRDSYTLRRATFTVAGRRIQTTARPFEVELPAQAISNRHPNRVQASASLADGRELTFTAGFERAC